MNDRAVNLLDQYDIEVLRTRKGRGAFLCDTSVGCLILKEYRGNEEKLPVQDSLLRHLLKAKDIRAEQLIPNREGGLSVKDHDGTVYILKTYEEGRECNINDHKECLDAVRLLARLHAHLEFAADVPATAQDATGANTPATRDMAAADALLTAYPLFSPAKEYEKRNRELRRVRKYLKNRSQKTWFEIYLQQHFDFFMEQAFALTDEWREYERLRGQGVQSGQTITYCHGDYQYHNILKTEDGWFLVNFEKCVQDDPVRDLYLLMRKLLEKSNWSVSLGRELLAAYEETRTLSALSRIDLYYRLAYPEKFWKVVNFYDNSGKAWIPGRNLEKLEKVVEQEESRQSFLDALFRTV